VCNYPYIRDDSSKSSLRSREKNRCSHSAAPCQLHSCSSHVHLWTPKSMQLTGSKKNMNADYTLSVDAELWITFLQISAGPSFVGGFRELNPGPLAPEASIMPLYQIPAFRCPRGPLLIIYTSYVRLAWSCIWKGTYEAASHNTLRTISRILSRPLQLDVTSIFRKGIVAHIQDHSSSSSRLTR
jgi:hypothetical protein